MENRDDSAVSPVVGVILMVAVTVVLSAAVGVFVFNLDDSLDSNDASSDTAYSAADVAIAEDGNASIQSFVGGSSPITDFEYVVHVDDRTARITAVKSDGTYSVTGDSSLITSPHEFTGGGLDDGTVDTGDSARFAIDDAAISSSSDVTVTVVHAPSDSQVMTATSPTVRPAGSVAGPDASGSGTLLSDDFSDGDFTSDPTWTETGTAGFYVDAEGNLRTPNADGDGTVTTPVTFDPTGNYTWTIDQRLTTLNKWQYTQIHVVYLDANTHVMVHMHEAGAFRLRAVESGSVVAKSDASWAADTNWHTIRVEKSGDQWTAYLDGTQKATMTYAPSYTPDKFALTSVSGCCSSSSNTGHEYDNVSVFERD